MTIMVQYLSRSDKSNLKIPPKPAEQDGWSVWECPPSEFEWHYDEEEHAFLYEGSVEVSGPKGIVRLKAGDYVIFPAGLTCSWKVIEKVVKVYRFC